MCAVVHHHRHNFTSLCTQLVDEPATAAEAALSSASSGSAAKAAGGTDSYTGSLEDAVLHNANQFHKWHTELEAACASETEQKYKRYAGLLGGYLALCDGLQDKVGKLPACRSACRNCCCVCKMLCWWQNRWRLR